MDPDYFTRNWLYGADGKGWNISMETIGDYLADCMYRERIYESSHMGSPTSEYDEYFRKHDAYIVAQPPLPPPEEEYTGFVIRDPYTPDPYRNRYMENPQAYCELIRTQLPLALEEKNGPELKQWETHTYDNFGGCIVTRGEHNNVAHIAKLPPDLLHLHDAIFPQGEVVEEVEIKMPPARDKYWWDADVIYEEFGHAPKPQDSVEYRVDWYLGHTGASNG